MQLSTQPQLQLELQPQQQQQVELSNHILDDSMHVGRETGGRIALPPSEPAQDGFEKAAGEPGCGDSRRTQGPGG